MRVIVPAVPAMLHQAVVPAIAGAGYNAEVWDVSNDDRAYYRALAALWNIGPALCIVEHDIEVDTFMLTDLATCAHDWCAYSYQVFTGDLMDRYPGSSGLGLVRFSARLQAKLPHLLDIDVPLYRNPAHPDQDGTHHRSLDAAISQWLRGPYGVQVHRHYPNVTHHHAYDYAGAWLPDDIRATLPAGHPLHLQAP